MIVIDTSAVMAILENEPERRMFNEVIEQADRCLMSAATYVETSVLIDVRRGYDGVRDFDLFVAKAGIEIMAVDVEQAKIARMAYRQFGKGRHQAKLNFGDCFPYALAKVMDTALLFKGEDFTHTDIPPAR